MLKIILLLIGISILAAMSLYAFRLLRQVKQQKLQVEQQINQARVERVRKIKESIEIIAKAMQSGECNLSEGVIRLKMLLDPLGEKRLNQYPAMWKLYETVQDMPILDARKSLKKNERMRLDLTRESTEAELEQAIKDEINQLLNDIK